MELLFEIIKFIVYSLIIVFVSKQILVKLLRRLAVILNLSPRAVGNVAGVATSMPELLTVLFSSIQGLFETSLYNILSSNVINCVQYIWSIKINKNEKVLKNKALKIEIGMVVVTVLIPILMIITGINTNITIVPIFILLFFALYYIKENAYKVYEIKQQSSEEEEEIQEEKKWVKHKKGAATITILKLLATGVVLFVVGNLLGNTLEALNLRFNIPEVLIGLILGLITSIPELITFVESQRHYNRDSNNTQGVIEATSNLFTSNTLNIFIIESIGILVYAILY